MEKLVEEVVKDRQHLRQLISICEGTVLILFSHVIIEEFDVKCIFITWINQIS